MPRTRSKKTTHRKRRRTIKHKKRGGDLYDKVKTVGNTVGNTVKNTATNILTPFDTDAMKEQFNFQTAEQEIMNIKTVSAKEMITAVLDKYLQLLKDGIRTKETNEKGKSIILMLEKDNAKLKNEIIEKIARDKDYLPYDNLWEAIGELTKENLEKINRENFDINIKKEFDTILYEYIEAEDMVQEITEKLQQPVINKKLSKKQIEQIQKIISNQDSMLGSLSKNVTAGFETLGSWLIPQLNTDLSGNPIKEYNETAVHFLWYPRMHKKYRKGNSSKGEQFNRYGDFMVYVEPEKYSSTSQFIMQSADSVDDLLANVLNGYDKPAVPEPYKHRIYRIKNNQPELDKVPPSNNETQPKSPKTESTK